MNANELADWLETIEGYPAIQAWGNKLRQQQAEIEALKRQVGILKQDVENWMDNAGQQPDEAYWERLLK